LLSKVHYVAVDRQNHTTVAFSNSGITVASNGITAVPSTAATVNFVADSGHATSIGGATQTGTYTFELMRGPVITAPEPTTMLLFGSGWLLIAGVLRRRLRRSKAK
jgi:hypothetical protein